MTIVSKFRLPYLFIGIVGWIFFTSVINILLIVLYADFCIDYTIISGSKIYFEYLELNTNILILWILVNISLTALYYIYGRRLTQITVTEEQIIVKDLLTRTEKRIMYNKITEINRKLQTNAQGNYMPRSFIVGRTAIRERKIRLKNGKSISFDDNMYKNFMDIDFYIAEKLENQL